MTFRLFLRITPPHVLDGHRCRPHVLLGPRVLTKDSQQLKREGYLNRKWDFTAFPRSSETEKKRYRKPKLAACKPYLNSIPSSVSPSDFPDSVPSGVKSEDRCAPARSIKPETKAQKIRATEMENVWPYTS